MVLTYKSDLFPVVTIIVKFVGLFNDARSVAKVI
jgi:hypothetical protein